MSDEKKTMKAIVFDVPHLGKIAYTDHPIPKPGDDDVLVEVVSAGLNPVDSGIAFKNPFGFTAPMVLGEDWSGVVKAVGKNVTAFKAGEDVFGAFPKTGAFAQYLISDSVSLTHKPKALSHAEAGALGIVVLTALIGIDDAKIEPGHTVFVPGGAGGVASLVIQFAKLAGARVISSGSNDSAIAFIKELKADHVFNYKEVNSIEEVKRLTGGKGADTVIDCVWALSEYSTAVRQDGKYVCIHTARRSNDEEPKRLLEGKASFKKFSVVPTWFSKDKDERAKKIQGGLKYVADLFAAGKLKTLHGKTVKLDQVVAELEEGTKSYGHNTGKIIVKIKD